MIEGTIRKLKKVRRALINIVAKYRQRRFSKWAQRMLKQNGFTPLRELGSGKDGAVVLCRMPTEAGEERVVAKFLSTYGKSFLPLTKMFLEKRVESPHLYTPEIVRDEILFYPFENLQRPLVNNKNFTSYLLQLCAIEQDLLRVGMLYWDFGFSDTPNYMVTSTGEIKLIDYGGNAFLLVEGGQDVQKKFVLPSRRNLVVANSRFVAIQFLLHIITVGLGKKGFELYPSEAQSASDEELTRLQQICTDELRGTSFEEIGRAVFSADVCTAEGWSLVTEAVRGSLSQSVVLSERADVNSVQFTSEGVRVVGYQSFVIDGDTVTPIRNEHADDLWDTRKKMKEVMRGLDEIEQKYGCPESFLDMGSNLGLYVFLAKKHYHIPLATGLDYNPEYVRLCREIVSKLDIKGCVFVQGTFGEYTEAHDVVLALGLIHHLYHRTEDFGSLERILEKFSRITTRALILEFPTEEDAKARKWTNMPFRRKEDEYSQKNFEQTARRYFKIVRVIGGTSPTRPLFLLEK